MKHVFFCARDPLGCAPTWQSPSSWTGNTGAGKTTLMKDRRKHVAVERHPLESAALQRELGGFKKNKNNCILNGQKSVEDTASYFVEASPNLMIYHDLSVESAILGYTSFPDTASCSDWQFSDFIGFMCLRSTQIR